MTIDPKISEHVFSRGFLLSQIGASDIRARLKGKPYTENLDKWVQTFFGPCTLWVDPSLNYARASCDQYAVGVMGLCINPFDRSSDNQTIASKLHECLRSGKDQFLDYIDHLSGSFIIIYRESANVYVLQDAAATKPVYYHQDSQGSLTAVGHIALLAYIYGLAPDPRAEAVYQDETYKADPSRYLPGMITPYEDAFPLTANHQLSITSGRSLRFFPRSPLPSHDFNDQILERIAGIMVTQARMIADLGRPLMLAATGGRDSRVSAATFSGLPGLSYFSFHMPSIGHLSDDVHIAQQLAEIDNVPLNIYELERYKDPEFQKAFKVHSPRGIWPAAALCYLREFPRNAIHIRSTVSEIGRIFYSRRTDKVVTPQGLAQTFTRTSYSENSIVTGTMRDFIEQTNFDETQFFNYSHYDMFYWEHRNSKWQNILCAEAEMATDVFIPFNNRNLLKLFMSVPYKNRLRADIHLALCDTLKPDFRHIKIV